MPVPRSICLLAALAVFLVATPGAGDPHVIPIKGREVGSSRLVMTESGELYLEVSPLRGEGYAALSKRVTGNPAHWKAIHKVNGGSRTIYTSRLYKIPLHLVPTKERSVALSKLWPKDRYEGDSWVHKVSSQKRFGRSESLWQLAQFFTGNGNNWKTVKSLNSLRSSSLRVGQEIRIPSKLLREEYKIGGSGEELEPVEATESKEPAPAAPYRITGTWVNGELEYGQDAEGPYALYRLSRGEALYSSVVIRFTGRIDAEEVNKTAGIIAERSNIPDVTDIPVGFPVKIPLGLLTPEFLPTDHPRRIAWEKSRAEGDTFARSISRAKNLQGVTLVLDAGHGGIDIGASNHNAWEDDYVYDILCRVKALVETHTQAKVVTTIRDKSQGYKPHNGTFARHDRDEVILTTPNFQHNDSSLTAVNVHLRWYISSYQYRQALRAGTSSDRVVFTSFHADSLHPSVRGSMVYVPGRDYRPTRYGKSGGLYMRYKEVRDKPTVSFTKKELSRSEGLSRALAGTLVRELKEEKIQVHRYKPIRNHVVRSGREWVPAVLRYNQVPTSLLVEVCNLNNAQDRALLRDPKFRQRFAEAYVESLIAHFDDR